MFNSNYTNFNILQGGIMEILNNENLSIREFDLYRMLDAFDKKLGKKTVKMGKAIMKPGVRVPVEGMNPHDADEFSYIVKGSLISGTEEITTTVSGGDFSFIPKGMKHWCKNEGNEDCELIWILVGEE